MVAQTTNKTVAEFFAGIGLMRAGLDRAGWTTTVANDIDPVKRKLYLNHFQGAGDHFLLEDIHKLTGKDIPTVDLATASFPCTDLSLAGRRAGLQGKHSSAFWGFVDILQSMGDRKPPLILLENVAGFLTSNNGEDFKDALTALNQQGYAVDAFIIDAVHFVPQSRVRLFIVGRQADEPNLKIRNYLPETELRPAKLVEFIHQHPEIYWAINTALPKLPAINNNLSSVIEKVPKSNSIWWNRERVDYLLNQTFERHLSKIVELKEQKYYSYLTAFRRVRNGKSMAEIRFDGIAGCLRTPKGGSARQILLEVGKGEINIRLLTPRECAKLMGADDFTLSGTANEALFGFGDAVCVPVVSWIAENYLNPEIKKLKQGQSTKQLYAATA
jgi:DNA (cytosine-5)-methyltransferase 1